MALILDIGDIKCAWSGKVRVISARPAHKKVRIEMKKSYVKSNREYDAPVKIEAEKILSAMKRYKNSPKKPTSIALDETTILELKKVAKANGIPYQVLTRVFILDGLSRLKKAA
ncbi:MAG: hypothetical protein JXA66_06275 [Oligoflexia bacterium]|nr:hypothetical protein [Oligoflexia bacterium]